MADQSTSPRRCRTSCAARGTATSTSSRRCGPALHGYCRRLTGNLWDAEDLVAGRAAARLRHARQHPPRDREPARVSPARRDEPVDRHRAAPRDTRRPRSPRRRPSRARRRRSRRRRARRRHDPAAAPRAAGARRGGPEGRLRPLARGDRGRARDDGRRGEGGAAPRPRAPARRRGRRRLAARRSPRWRSSTASSRSTPPGQGRPDRADARRRLGRERRLQRRVRARRSSTREDGWFHKARLRAPRVAGGVPATRTTRMERADLRRRADHPRLRHAARPRGARAGAALEERDGGIARLRGYAFCPETMREVGAALGLRVRTGLYRYPTPAPGVRWQ